ncbi:MAG: hypothetical protein ACHQEM_02485 [Chitinophagales bacterium]
MKYATSIGIIGGVLLIIACFLPWAYYPDIDKNFTGFFSEQNMYGKPGKFLVFLSLVTIVLFIIPRIWAKRTNLLVTAIVLAFAIKSFILFSACYHGICPEKKFGVFLLLAASVLMVIASIFPDIKLKEKQS